MKKIFVAIIFVAMFAASSITFAADVPKISADSAILVEASTGRIICEKNSDAEREPASMTKMLTCIIALEQLDPLDEIKMSRAAVFTEDNTLAWAEGDILSA